VARLRGGLTPAALSSDAAGVIDRRTMSAGDSGIAHFIEGFHGIRYPVKDVARAFANVSFDGADVLLSGPGAPGSRQMPDGKTQEPAAGTGSCCESPVSRPASPL